MSLSMARAPLGLIVAGALAALAPPSVAASSPDAKSGKFNVRVRVVSSCGVRVDSAEAVQVRCTRGGADRVLLQTSQPQVVTLERDASRMMTAEVQTGGMDRGSGSERILTLQF